MDPNLNRNSMGSRAGGVNLRNNLTTGGAIGAPSRLGTAGRVKVFLFRLTQPSVELAQLSMFRIDLSQI
jgi:hypothetical protein